MKFKVILKYSSTKIEYTNKDLNSLYYYLLSTTLHSLDTATSIHLAFNNKSYRFSNMKQLYTTIEEMLEYQRNLNMSDLDYINLMMKG